MITMLSDWGTIRENPEKSVEEPGTKGHDERLRGNRVVLLREQR